MPALMAEGESSGESPAVLTPVAKLSQDDANSPSPRRSSRMVKQPVLYGLHTLPSGLPRAVAAQIAQQKREEGQDSSDDDSAKRTGPETPTKASTTRKGQKRTASALKNSPFAKRPRMGKTQRASPAKRRKKGGAADDQGSLFDIIKAGKSALRVVVDDWIESYHKDKENAVVDLLQFFVQCCGCKGTVTTSMLEEEENINAIRQLTEQFDEESHEYPLIMSGPMYKKFKSNFVDFVNTLIVQCQHGIIYDEYMLDTLISWLIRLADSQVRAFRHTSTLAGLKLVSSLIQIAVNVNEELEHTQRQLDIESKKVSSKKAMDKIEGLENKKQEAEQNIKELEDMMTFIHQGIFVHRYRDTRPEIRSFCISEIGEWMKNYSTVFLADKYLKYTVWNLHDKAGEVRLKTLQALQGLYSRDEFLPQLESLTERFKDRLVSMTLDRDNDVAVEAVKLVSILLSHDKLQEDDCQQVELLVFCDHRQVAHAAGEFLFQRIASAAEEELGKTKSKRGSKKSERDLRALHLKKLIDFLITSQVHNHGAYLVDSLWNTTQLLKDWKLMTDILLDESGKEDLEDAQERSLIDLMVCAVRQTTQGQGPPGRAIRKTLSAKEKKLIVGEKKELSAHFMQEIPELLGKYGTDVENVVNLVSLPQYFDLEEYGQRRLGKHLDELLKQLSDIVQKHSDELVLEECGKTYRVLTESEYTLSTVAVVSRNNLIDEFVQKFKTSLKDGLAAGDENGNEEEDEDEDRFALKVSLKKIAAFSKSHNLDSWELHNGLNTIIEYAQNKSVQDEILIQALTAMFVSLVWSLKALDSSQPNKNDMKTLKRRATKFISQCDELVQYSTPEVQRQAFIIMCDLFVLFAKQLKHNNPTLAPLVYEPANSIQVRCTDYAISYVFTDTEEELNEEEDDDESDEKAEELNRKRKVLSAFCKLIAFNVFDMKYAAPVLAYIGKGLGDFGDIIKYTMSKCREINQVAFARTILFSLQQEFEKLREEREEEEEEKSISDSDEFAKLKELAHKFAQSFGVDQRLTGFRQSMMMLQREGILYSFNRGPTSKQSQQKRGEDVPPDNLVFLEVLNEFSYRLIQPDKTGKNGVLKYLEEHARDALSKKGGQWSPLILYKNGLTQQQGNQTDQQKGSRARRKLSVEGEATEGEWLNKQSKVAPKQKQQKGRAPRGRTPRSGSTKRTQTSPPTQTKTRRAPPRNQAREENRVGSPSLEAGEPRQTRGQRSPPGNQGEEESKVGSPSPEAGESNQTREQQAPPGNQGEEESKVESPPLESGESSQASSQLENQEGEEGNVESPSREWEDSSQESVVETPQETSQKRKRDTSLQEEGEGSGNMESDNAADDEDGKDFESASVSSSQRSWLTSQPQRKKPRMSYSKKDMSTVASRAVHQEEAEEIEDYESDDETESSEKAPIHTKRQKRDLPDDVFDDTQESKESEESEDLTSAFS